MIKILQAKWRVLYFNDIELYGSGFIRYCQLALVFTAPIAFPLIGTLSVLSHFTEPMRFIILSKKSLGLVLLCFKRVNIMTPLVVSVNILLTINMSKANTS